VQTRTYDEETRGLLRKIIEGQAYRQLMLANIRGHGIKLVPDLDEKQRVAETLAISLRQFAEVQRLYAALDFGDVVSAVRHKMERVPYPNTRMELAMCLFLCERVSRYALASYADSSCKEFAAIARTRLEELRPLEEPVDPAFVEFCADDTNRPLAQQLFDRWLGITLLSLGRPHSPGDARAVALGLRNKPVAVIVRAYLDELGSFLGRCKLALPEASALGLEIAATKAAARGR